MRSMIRAFALSVAIHCALAALLALWMGSVRRVDLATLDLSAVELSFAADESDSSPVSSVPTSGAEESAPRPREEPPPESPPDERFEAPPQMDNGALPEPGPEAVEPIPETPREPPPAEAAPPPAEAAPPPAEAPRQARIDAPARPVRSIRPDYPYEARMRGESGDVVLEIDVSPKGAASDVRVVASCGYDDLDEAAAKSARRARFVPAKAGGEAVASTVRMTISFTLK